MLKTAQSPNDNMHPVEKYVVGPRKSTSALMIAHVKAGPISVTSAMMDTPEPRVQLVRTSTSMIPSTTAVRNAVRVEKSRRRQGLGFWWA